jgi:hypothetical protein
MEHRAFALKASTGIALASLIVTPLAGCSSGGGLSSALPAAPVSSVPAAAATAAGRAAIGSTEAQANIVDAGKKKKAKLLFVSDNKNNRILVYNTATKVQNPSPMRTITIGIDGPNGITTDLAGNLYVANYVSDTVTVYAPNASAPKMTISNGVNGPWDIKVDGFGNVYVANDPLQGVADIQEYPPNSSIPSYTWTVPTAGEQISGIALLNPMQQNQTSIYALEYTENPSSFATGGTLTCYPGSPTCTQVEGFLFGQTGGITVAQSPSSKPFEFLAVDQYVPGIDTFTLGSPMSQFVTGGTPEFITLNAMGNQLFVADRFHGRVTEYSFPDDKQLNTFTPGGGQIYGVATFPAGTYH